MVIKLSMTADHRSRTCSNLNITETVKRRFPIIRFLPKYNVSFLLQDILAGVTVGITEITQGVAYALVAGIPIEYGLYSGIMGGFMYFIFGTCKDIHVGPTALMALFVQSSVATMGPDAAVLICFLSGFVIFLAGILRLGFIVEFFSFPVISGFVTAAALSIASLQLMPILGIKRPATDFLHAWLSLFKYIGETRKWDAILGFASGFGLFIFREIKKYGSLENKPEWSRKKNILGKILFFLSLGGNALTLTIGIGIAFVADKCYNAAPFFLTVSDIVAAFLGAVPSGLPLISLPPFSTTWKGIYFSFTDMISEFGSLVVFCPLVAFLEHIIIVKSYSKGKIVDATQELLALGLCNMAGSLVHSKPLTASFASSAINNASGVRTTTAGLISSLTLMLSLATLTTLFKYIPKATLAAIIMVAMYYLCDFKVISVMWKTKKLDLIPYFTTLLCSLFISFEFGILIGIAVSLVFILYYSVRPKLYIERDVIQENVVYIIKPKVGLFFASSEYMREQILKKCGDQKSTIVIDGEFVRNIDSTVAKSFADLLDDLNVKEQKLIFWNFSKSVIDICTGESTKLTNHFKKGSLDTIIITDT